MDITVVVDFIMAALPFVILGISIALIVAELSKRAKQKKITESDVAGELVTNRQASRYNYLLGIMFGVGMGACFGKSTDNLALGISLGLLWVMIMIHLLNGNSDKKKQASVEQKETGEGLVQELVEMEDTFQEKIGRNER